MRGRSLKDRGFTKLKVIEHPITKRTAEIKLNKSSGEFGCEIGDMSKTGTLREVEQWASAYLKQREIVHYDWQPVIYASVSGSDSWYKRRGEKENDLRSVKVEISASRFYIARASKDPDGKEVWRQLSWIQCDADSPDRLPESELAHLATKFREPSEGSGYRGSDSSPAAMKGWVRLPEVKDGHYLLAYDAELWAGIQHVIDTIENEEKILDQLFTTKAGREMLTKIGTQPELLRLTSGS